jgi:CBS domain-containing protein
MKIREIMTPRPEVLTPRDEVTLAAQMMRSADVGFIPVVDDLENLKLVGVITDRDIALRCVGEHRDGSTPIGDVMSTTELDCVRPDDDAHDAIGRMRHDQVRRVPVVDTQHRVVGVVSQADLALRLGPKEPLVVERMLEGISRPVPH